MAKNKTRFEPSVWSAFKHWHHSFWRWYKGIFVGRPWYIKMMSAVGTLLVCLLLFVVAVDINFLWLFGKSPSLNSVMHPKTNNASYVYSADGKLLCKYFDENRTPVTYGEINPMFFKALIDTEDERFYSRPRGMAVDFLGIFSAVKDAMFHSRARGASTISQQLAKNMFKVRSNNRGLLCKIPGLGILISKTKEWTLATKLEIFNNKENILTMYANTVDFGNNSYGIKTAARTYYNTTPDSLTVDQCAVLVGLLKATSSYNPRSNPERSMQRRNVVLLNMVRHGDLSRDDYERLSKQATPLNLHVETADQGLALYFRNAVNDEMAAWCEENDVDFFTDGLKIYTTIDTRMQEYAEQAVMEQMYEIQRLFDRRWGDDDCWVDENEDVLPNFAEQTAEKCDFYKQLKTKYPHNPDSVSYYMKQPREMRIFEYKRDGGKVVPSYSMKVMSPIDSVRHMLHYMHAGFVAMDPKSGFVKAWVGDIDYKTWKYDKVKSMRQPGSTFKLFVYAAAMEKGLSPCDRRLDDYISLEVYNEEKQEMEQYQPHNAQGYFSGENMTLREAFARSINSVAVRVGTEIGMNDVEKTAYDLGIKSPLRPKSATCAKPSLCLGSMDVNLLEMTNAYSTIANYGRQHDPVLVKRIMRVDPDGGETEIYNYEREFEETQAVKARTAFLMQKMLVAGVSDAEGTSQRLSDYVDPYMDQIDFGGKTGTSQNHSDAWFIGVTPNLVCGAWVGGEYRCIHLTSSMGQGSRSALPICGRFFQKVLADRELRPGVVAKFVPIDIPENAYECGIYDERDTQEDSHSDLPEYDTVSVEADNEKGESDELRQPIMPGEETGITGGSHNAVPVPNSHNNGGGNEPQHEKEKAKAAQVNNRVSRSFNSPKRP